jgi:hypothetical protein
MYLSSFASAKACVQPRSSTHIRACATVDLFASAIEAAIELLGLLVAAAGGNAEAGEAVVTVRSVVEEGEVLVWARKDPPPRKLRRMAVEMIRFHADFPNIMC